MIESTVQLREYLEKVCCIRMEALSARIDAHEREHELLAEALGKAEAAVNQRLGAMNELRDQINTERNEYARTEVLKADVKALSDRIETLRNVQAASEGRDRVLGVILSLAAGGFMSLVVKLLS